MNKSDKIGIEGDTIRVLVVEDHEMMRQLIGNILAAEDDMEIVGEATDGLEAIEVVQEVAPDVVVMDLALPRLGGIQVMQKLKAMFPDIKVLFVSVYDQMDMVQGAVKAGARGYLQKQSIFKELIPAVRAVSKGEGYFSDSVARYASPADDE